MKVLFTGISCFVQRCMARWIKASDFESEVLGIDKVTSISHFGIPRPYWLAGFVAVFLSSCFVLLFILLSGANVPFQDEFAFAGLARAMRLGQVSFATFWAPHNEHRILIPRIIFIISNPIIGWNSLATMVLSWSIITGTALFLFQRLATVFDLSKKRLWLALVGLSFLALFSPIQSENWLWGFQLCYFLVQAGVILSLFSVSLTSIHFAIRLGLAILFAAVASLSSAQGLMAWPALIVTVLLTEEPKQRKLGALLVLCLVTALLFCAYFTNYQTPSAGHLTFQEIVRDPQAPLLYLLGLLGGPLTFWLPDNLKARLAITFGSILLLLFGWFCYLNLAKGHRGKAAPWVGLACFVLAFCLMTAVGRAGEAYKALHRIQVGEWSSVIRRGQRGEEHGILSVFHYLPLQLSDMGRRYGGAPGDCPVTERVSDQIVRLPFYNQMTEAEQSRVISVIRDVEV